jgi:hypothetical protein
MPGRAGSRTPKAPRGGARVPILSRAKQDRRAPARSFRAATSGHRGLPEPGRGGMG